MLKKLLATNSVNKKKTILQLEVKMSDLFYPTVKKGKSVGGKTCQI